MDGWEVHAWCGRRTAERRVRCCMHANQELSKAPHGRGTKHYLGVQWTALGARRKPTVGAHVKREETHSRGLHPSLCLAWCPTPVYRYACGPRLFIATLGQGT